jgi:glycerophosphoryl diester phosphodiesterase
MELMSDTTIRAVRRPLLIAHRGASADAPENTIAAFELALDQGADAIEVDVHLSRDHHPVVIHDFTLERTTDGAGVVAGHTVRELKRLDAGGWRSPLFRGQRVQTLQEVLERFRGRTRVWIDLKGGSDVYAGLEERIVSMLEVYEVIEGSVVQSYDHRALEQMRVLNRDVRVAARLAETSGELQFPETLAGQAVCLPMALATESVLAQLRRAGMQAYVSTVNEPIEAARLARFGASGLITDRPGALAAHSGW